MENRWVIIEGFDKVYVSIMFILSTFLLNFAFWTGNKLSFFCAGLILGITLVMIPMRYLNRQLKFKLDSYELIGKLDGD